MSSLVNTYICEKHPMNNYKNILKDIDTLVFDVDGVMTNGKLTITPEGDMLRTMNIKDGYALKIALENNIRIIIISGGNSKSVRTRFENLGVKSQDIMLGTLEKLEKLQEYVAAYNLDLKKIMYMGDDMPDVPALKVVGLPCCPCDAVPEVKDVCTYISPYFGGEGAVRDIVEQILKAKRLW